MFTPSAAACNLRTVPSLDVYPSDEACSPKTVPSLGPEIKKWVTQCVYCAGFDIQFNIVVKNAVGTVRRELPYGRTANLFTIWHCYLGFR